MNPRILLYDTEVSRAVVEGYGNKWEFKVVKFVRHQELMCYAYKWLGDKKTRFVGRHDFKSYHDFVQSLVDLMDTADVVIAHNAVKFDNKMSNTFFVTEGILPPSPFKTIDTLQVARSVFKFPSNSLNDLAEFLNLGHKEKITYADLEDDYMSDHPSRKTVRHMKKYTIKDVDLLELIYLTERPYMKSHPNMAALSRQKFACTYCSSTDLQSRGQKTFGTGTFQYYLCKNCGHHPRDRVADKAIGRPDVV